MVFGLFESMWNVCVKNLKKKNLSNFVKIVYNGLLILKWFL